jgi:dTDP-4-dehydrorhamnose 3,5-epimerase-like enzyme
MSASVRPDTPLLLEGDLAIDDRGTVSFVNDFSFDAVKRFYVVANHRPGFIRAWHAHRREAKYVVVVSGAAIVAAVRVDDWEQPSRDTEVHRYVMASARPSILHIPAGFCQWIYVSHGRRKAHVLLDMHCRRESRRRRAL